MTASRARYFGTGAGLPLGPDATPSRFALVSAVSPLAEARMQARSTTQVPTLGRRHLRRPRLTRVLDASTAQALILTAPAGYGKTSLVCEWLEGQPNVAWYRATSASADLAAFSAGIAEVIEPFLPGAGDRLRQRIRVGDPPEKALRPLAELLAEDIAGWPESGWLVVDDYHLVADSAPVEEFMDWLLMLAPVRVIVTSRHRPAWATARRVLYGEAIEIGREQLAMTNEEATKVLEGRSPDAVNAIVAQAQGWPALIGLAALSSSTEVPTERVSEELFRYFAEEVFRNEPPEVQEFMLVAAVPQTFNAKTAREVLAVQRPEPIIDRLIVEGFLHETSRADLAFHPLLRDFLRRKLEHEAPDRAGCLADAVVSYARRAERWEEAFDLLVHRNRVNEAVRLLGEGAIDLLASGRIETLEKWLDICGSATATDPKAMLANGEVLLRRGQLPAALEVAKSIAEQLGPGHDLLSRSLRLAGRAAHFLSQNEDALTLHAQALDAATTASDRASSLWGAALSAAELELEAVDTYLDTLDALPEGGIDRRLRVATGRSMAARARGSLERNHEATDSLLTLARFTTDPTTKSGFLAWVAYLKYMSARYSEAEALATEAGEICTGFRLMPELIHCNIYLANAVIGLRQGARASRLIRVIGEANSQVCDPYVNASVTCLELKLSIMRSSTDPHRTGPPGTDYLDAPPSIRGEVEALTALIEAARGANDLAQERIDLARGLTNTVEARYLSAIAGLLLTHPPWEDPASGRSEWCELLQDVHRAGALDCFVAAYRVLPELLEFLKGDPRCEHVVRNLLFSSNDRHLARVHGIGLGHHDDTPEDLRLLTARELEVLELIRLGLTNAEIAERLVVAPSTAKVHVHNVLTKLGARSRLQAALRAERISELDSSSPA